MYPLASRRQIGGLGQGGGTSVNPYLALFPAGDDVGAYVSFITPYRVFNIFKHTGYQNKYWQMKVGRGNPAVGQNSLRMNDQAIVNLWVGFNDQSTPAITNSGFTIIGASVMGARIMYATDAVNKYIEVAITNSTSVGAFTVPGQTNGGMVLVSIDGDNTLADLLPTAQDLVDGGSLAASALVGGGGTLNSTDRIWDQYNLTGNYALDYPSMATYFQKFSESLSLGTHTVRITNTPYKNGSSSGAVGRVNLICGTSTSKRATSGGFIFGEKVVDVDLGTGNVWDVSYYFKPNGATNYAWLGHDNQSKIVTAFSASVDGETALADWAQGTGNEVVLTQESSIRHSEIGGGATVLGTIDMTYTINKATGLTISNVVTWDTTGLIQGYSFMMALSHAVFDRFNTAGNAAKDLTSQDSSVNMNTTGQYAWAWDLDGYAGALMYIPDLSSVDNWANSETDQLFWMDTSIATWKKAYAKRFRTSGSIYSFADEEVMSAACQYRVNWFPDGANASMSGLT